MKKNILYILILFLIAHFTVIPVYAEWGKKKTPQKPVSTITPEQTLQSQVRNKALRELSKKEWIISLTPLEPAKSKSQTIDIITFSEGKFTSKHFASQGAPSVNYTFEPQDNGAITWEAMQAGSNIGTLFWKGELKDESIQGILSKLSVKGEVEDFVFRNVEAYR